MGTAHSRRKPGNTSGVTDVTRLAFWANIPPPKAGYFILSLKPDKIKVVNAEAGVLRLLTTVIKKHGRIAKEGWDRHLTYSYRLVMSGCQEMIQLVADTLMFLYQAGWEPMTPLQMSACKNKEKVKSDIVTSSRIDICFRSSDMAGGSKMGSTNSIRRESTYEENSCLCLQTFRDADLICHNVSNTVLLELVNTLQQVWRLRGVSVGVGSVIQDYTANMPRVLSCEQSGTEDIGQKLMRLQGKPWRTPGDGERLQSAIIGCVTKLGYRLSMDITLDVLTNTRVFFLIKTCGDDTGNLVTVPNNSGAGLGEKETLSVYRPLLIRHKSSFFRSYHGKSNSFRQRIRASMRRRAMMRAGRQESVRKAGAVGRTAWWQQESTDCSSGDLREDREDTL